MHSMIEQVGTGAMTSPGFLRALEMELILHVSSFVCTSRLHRTVFITSGSPVCFENSFSRQSEVLGRRQNSDYVDSWTSRIETSSIQLNRWLPRHLLRSQQEFSTEVLLCAGRRADMYCVSNLADSHSCTGCLRSLWQTEIASPSSLR